MTSTGFQPPGAFVAHLIKSGFRRHGPVTTVDDLEIHNLDLTSLNLDVGILVPFVISKRLSAFKIVNSEQLGKVLPDVVNLAQKLQRRFLVLTVGGELKGIEQQLIEDMKELSIAIMDLSTIEGVLDTNDPEVRAKVLSAALVNYLGREALSPYVSGRPAIGGRFFGRSSLVNTLIPSAGNFTVVGNRRIGKTSLLIEIKERLKLQGVRTGQVYGATCNNTVDVVYKLLNSVGKFREAEHILTYPAKVKNLASHIHSIPAKEKTRVAVFIDEVDRILEFDAEQNYQVLHLLRETFEADASCRLFLAGFRKAIEVSQTFSAPLFNFTTVKQLPLFNRDETFQMVTRPLERLGIPVSGTDLPESIYHETSGHPELIQIHCAAIVRFMQDYNRVPSATELLSGVLNTIEHKQKVLGTLLANANPYETLLCFLLMSDAEQSRKTVDYRFDLKDVQRVLSKMGINMGMAEVSAVIVNLKVSGIISQVPGTHERYRFSAAGLVDYCSALKLETLIEEAVERLTGEDYTKSTALKRAAIFEQVEEPEQTATNPLTREKKQKTFERSESLTRIRNLATEVKHIYFMPHDVMVTQPEATENYPGSLETATVEDLNNRCLDIIDHWTTQGIFEQRLRGIGKQLSDALKLAVPDLMQHLTPVSDRQQFVIITDGAGLKIPFELLPHEKSNLAVNAAVARRLLKYRLTSDVHAAFHQLITSLNDRIDPLRVLLVASVIGATVHDASKELSAVRKHIEAGCAAMNLEVDFVEILPGDATSKNLEKKLVEDRPFHLWHFTGHGEHFSEDADASGIVLIGDKQEPEVVTCKRLNRWLKGSGLWLAYLSSCHTSASSGSNAGLSQTYVGTMEAVVSAGVPNVVGFRWSVSDQSAFHLADEFYRQLFEVQTEKNLSLAMLEARRAVERRADFFDAWASSMLVTQYS